MFIIVKGTSVELLWKSPNQKQTTPRITLGCSSSGGENDRSKEGHRQIAQAMDGLREVLREARGRV